MSESTLPGNTSLPSSQDQIDQLIGVDHRSHKYQVEDFFKNPEKSNFKISPDGQTISFMAPHERRKNIHIFSEDLQSSIRITDETERDIAGYGWANKNRLIYIKDSGGDENFTLFAVDKDGSNLKDLTPFEKVRIQIIDVLKDQEDHLIIGMNKNNPMLFEPYRINIHSGELTQLATNDNPMEPLDGWMTDNEGKLRICVKTIGGVNQTILYRDTEQDEFKEILTTSFKDQMAPVHFDGDNTHIVYAISNLDRDKTVLIRYNMHTSKEEELVYAAQDYDISNIIWSRKKEKLIGVSYTSWKSQTHFFDNERAEIQNFIESKLPNQEVRVVSVDREEKKWIIRTFTDRSLGAFYLFDAIKGSITLLAEVSPWLKEDDLSPMKAIQYQTRDGLTIHGYLTLPKNTHKPMALIVNPHGGPWVRDSWGYNPEVQLLASRGYAVFQMNYRGSTGYGKQFWECSFKKWGKEMQDDITDGVQYLINEGIADADKIAIYGGSYGGYATLAGITFTPDLYCCAIDFVGVSNLFTFLETIPPYWKPYLDMLREMVGHPIDDKELLESASPAYNTDKIKTPLFVVQGANDPRVNIDEADQIVSSLRSRGIDVPYLVKYDEGHGFAKEENKFEFYRAALGFLYKYLG